MSTRKLLCLERLESRYLLAVGVSNSTKVDLYGWDCNAPDSALWGAAVSVQAQVARAGTAAAGSFRVEWYLSKDARGSSGDLLLAQTSGARYYTHAGIAAGAAAGPDFTVNLCLPGRLPPGWSGETFYVIMKTDAKSQVKESNETNNFGQAGLGHDYDPIVVRTPPSVDLTGYDCYAPASASWGQTINVQSQVKRTGTGAAGPFQVQWYLSRDRYGSADDVLLVQAGGSASYAHAAVAAGSTYGPDFTVSLRLPNALPAGWTGQSFYVVMKTDAANQVAETNENNNFGQVGPQYDYDPIAVTTPGGGQQPSGYHIELTFSGLTASQQLVFQQAAGRWEQIIVGDLPDASYYGRLVDDMLIDVSGVSIDGAGGILGQAGATNFRSGAYGLPYRGLIQLDTADLASMQSSGALYGVMVHEMAHVLGFGIVWSWQGLLTGASGSDPRFIGSRATAEYNAVFGRSDSGVPVEAGGGSGTRLAHWRESTFNTELLTGWYNMGRTNPLSRITVASMADIGYQVNMAAADAYTAGGSSMVGLSAAASSVSRVMAGLQTAAAGLGQAFVANEGSSPLASPPTNRWESRQATLERLFAEAGGTSAARSAAWDTWGDGPAESTLWTKLTRDQRATATERPRAVDVALQVEQPWEEGVL